MTAIGRAMMAGQEPHRLAEDEAVDGRDQAEVVRGGKECPGHQWSPDRMLPPHQGLEAGDAPGRQGDDRLELHDELAVVQCPLEAMADGGPVGGVKIGHPRPSAVDGRH